MYPEEQGGPGYPVTVEVLHQLHCLVRRRAPSPLHSPNENPSCIDTSQNLLRQSSYLNIDYYKAQGKGPFVNSEATLKYHISAYIHSGPPSPRCGP